MNPLQSRRMATWTALLTCLATAACGSGSVDSGHLETPSVTSSAPMPSPSQLPTPTQTANHVDGSSATFTLHLSFSGQIEGTMSTAQSTKGLCDPNLPRVDVILDGNIGDRAVGVQILVDRQPGAIRGIFVVAPKDQTNGIGSMAATYVIGADRISGSVESNLGPIGATPVGHASGSWQCQL